MRRPRAATAGPLVVAGALAVLSGCSSGGGGSSSATTSSTTVPAATTRPATTLVTVATTPIPGPGATTTPSTAPVASTSPATTATTTTVASTVATTTIPPGPTTTSGAAATTTTTTATGPVPACDPTALLAAANETFDLPPGATLDNPQCVGRWASALITASGQDNAFAVFEVIQGRWEGANLGTDQVCSAAGVPEDLWGPLGCGPWEG